jgi:uncharacterized RDD family membrane protein YckC
MKCPKCGFVSFPGLLQCRKCGYRLADSREATASASAPTSVSADATESFTDARQIIASSTQPMFSAARREPERRLESVTPGLSPRAPVAPGAAAAAGTGNPSPTPGPTAGDSRLEQSSKSGAAWSDEITNRVADYRRRQSSARAPAQPEESLEFDFEAGGEGEANSVIGSRSPSRGAPRKAFDVAFEERGERGRKATVDSLPAFNPVGGRSGSGRFTSGSANAPPKGEASPGPVPLDLLDSALPGTEGIPASDFAQVASAPLSKRFWAGVVDGLILLAAGCVFAFLFWAVGGHVQRTTAAFVIIVSVAVFWVFIYFASFSAIALSTPGQSLMGLSLRNIDGGQPSVQECFLRAFGYLVSIASVMLGFLWAAMDSDGLAWHDHISGTCLVERGHFSNTARKGA